MSELTENVFEKLFNFNKIELLNSLTYYNYGQIISAQCCDLSKANRLTLCTDKCIFILNFNFMWPLSVVNCSPAKFLNDINQGPRLCKKTMTTTASNSPSVMLSSDKTKLQIDTWKKDLNDAKNESFYLNIIRSIKKSQLILDIYMKFLKIDEILKKTKSFHRELRDSVISNKNFIMPDLTKINNSDEQTSIESSLKRLKNTYSQQYSLHKYLTDQTVMFDSYFCEYLGNLNPIKQNQTNLSNSFESGFKYVKWNLSLDTNLLCAITNCNQLLLFDCTELAAENNVNLIESQLDDQQKPTQSFENVFDSKTNSKYLNLTEFWLTKYRSHIINSSPTTIQDFLKNLNQITPTCISWSHVIMINKIEFELIFVAFKSNEIGIFLIYKSNKTNAVEIKLCGYINLKDEIDIAIVSNSQDEFLCVDLNGISKTLITSLNFWNEETNSDGLLSVATQNGLVFVIPVCLEAKNLLSLIEEADKNLDLESATIKSEIFSLKIFGNRAKIHKLEFIRIESNLFLLVIQKENSLLFKQIIHEPAKKKIRDTDISLNVHFKDETISKEDNLIIKNLYKLISFKLIDLSKLAQTAYKLEFILTFENSYLEHFSLKVEKDKLTQLSQANKGQRLKQPSNRQGANDLLKITKGMFFSMNNYLLYQISEFPQALLIQKRSPQFQINVFRIRPNNMLLKSLLDMDRHYLTRKHELVNVYDLIWLIKNNLYLNKGIFFTEEAFEFFYECIKSSQMHLNSSNFKETELNPILSNFKRLRIMCLIFGDYFEMMSSFDFENIRSSEVADESDDEEDAENDDIDEPDVDEEDEDTNQNKDTEMSDSKPDVELLSASNGSNKIIKSSGYYRSMFNEYTLNIFKYYSLSFILNAQVVGLQNLSEIECLILYLFCDFTLKKNFSSKKITETILKKLMNEAKSLKKFNLDSTLNSLNCELCEKHLKIDSSFELYTLKCELGHSVSRCQKSLLPLNTFYFKKCSNCNSTWNYFDKNDLPNFSQLIQNQNMCIFCD